MSQYTVESLLDSDDYIMVGFLSESCPACTMVENSVQSFLNDYPELSDKVVVKMVDSDDNRSLNRELQILFNPTLVMYKGKVEQSRIIGNLTLNDLVNFVNNALEIK